MIVYFRTDASSYIGSGHVMRCITLAEELNNLGVSVVFITLNCQGNLNQYIRNKGFKISPISTTIPDNFKDTNNSKNTGIWSNEQLNKDAEETIRLLNKEKPNWLVIDHYSIDITWENRLRPYVEKIMVIDDLANRQHSCDLLLDQNYTHNRNRYSHLLNPSVTKLLGPQYALLRKEFTVDQPEFEKNKLIENIFIFFGGSDPGNLTGITLKALTYCKINYSNIDVVIGSSNCHKKEVTSLVEKLHKATLYEQVDNISDLMRKADISLGAGGTSTWERMVIGLPSIVVTIADNQVPSIKDLDKDNYLIWIGNANRVSKSIICNALSDAIQNYDDLKEMSQKGKKLVSRLGSRTVAKILSTGPDKDTLFVRESVYSDYLLYWYWVNDPAVRNNSFKQQDIALKDHQVWFENCLDNPNTILLVIESNLSAIGQVRFDYFDSYYTIDYSISRQFRGFGLGRVVLSRAIDYLKKYGSFTLIGDIKESNLASCKVFEQVGFTEIFCKSIKNVRRYKLQYSMNKFTKVKMGKIR